MIKVRGLDLEKCVFRANRVLHYLLDALKEDAKMQGREGCVISITTEKGVPLFAALIGSVTEAQLAKYWHFAAQEKAARLGLLRPHHVLSRESANDELERYAGAIAGTNFNFSTSGFPADVDEMNSLALAVAMGDLEVRRAGVFPLIVHSNLYFERLKYLLELRW